MILYCYYSCTCSGGSKSQDLRSELTQSVANEEGASPPIYCSKNLPKQKSKFRVATLTKEEKPTRDLLICSRLFQKEIINLFEINLKIVSSTHT